MDFHLESPEDPPTLIGGVSSNIEVNRLPKFIKVNNGTLNELTD